MEKSMTTLATRMRELADLEDFDVQVLRSDGTVVDASTNGFPRYDYDRRAKGTMTVADWKTARFNTAYPGYSCKVLNGDGTEARGNTMLATVRETYEEQ